MYLLLTKETRRERERMYFSIKKERERECDTVEISIISLIKMKKFLKKILK